MGKRGPKPGTGGRPKKALIDNLADGNPGKRPLTVLDENLNHKTQDLTPPEYLQETGIRIFNQLVDWLKPTGCLGYINPEHIAEYALCKQRWLDCIKWNNQNLLAKHPTTGQPMTSPYVSMEQQFLKLADEVYAKIWDIVKENSTTNFRENNPNDDVMEALLTKGKRSRNRG